MKKLIAYLLTLLATCLLLSSCKKDSMEFETISSHKVFSASNTKDTSNVSCDVEMTFLSPINFSDKKIEDAIRKELIAYALDSTFIDFSAKDAVNRFMDNTSRNFNYTVASLQTLGLGKQLHYKEIWKLNTKIYYNNNNIVSYKLFKKVYTGGAHGMEADQFLVFDLKTGKKITEHDIFEDGFEPKLSDLMKQQIMFDHGYESAEQMLNNGFFGIGNIKPNGNFAISDSAITYIFNPYEIACYANGETQVSIPFSKIRCVLRKQSPISHLFKD